MEPPDTHDRNGRIAPAPAMLVRDMQACIPLIQMLGQGDLLYLVTPVIAPIEPPPPGIPSRDPFESFGRALAKYHPWVRHVPYMARDGITRYHAGHLAFAKIVIFVITGPPVGGQPSQVALAQTARSLAINRPLIVLACCDLNDLGPIEHLFPTLVEIRDYGQASLEAAADMFFRSKPIRDRTLPPPCDRTLPPPRGRTLPPPRDRMLLPRMSLSPQRAGTPWRVDEWNLERDLVSVCELTRRCLPSPFRLDSATLYGLLNRPGYSKHFVVLEPFTRELMGFCATYTTFIDNNDSTWIGSIALLLVQPSYQRCGVGTALHNHALRQLAVHRVSRLQLGSTFPRLLYGIPIGMPSEEDWFRRRGWRIDSLDVAGSGQEACDWVLDFDDWRADRLVSRGLTFRTCHADEFDRVLEFVARESVRQGNVGWYDQYYQLASTPNISDILLGFEGNVLVTTALTYIPCRGGRTSADLPWARTISDDVGGVCCVCITDDHLSLAHTRDSVMIRLLDFCVRNLRERGMRKMFMDAVRGGYEGFQTIGFHKWAGYRDVWCDV